YHTAHSPRHRFSGAVIGRKHTGAHPLTASYNSLTSRHPPSRNHPAMKVHEYQAKELLAAYGAPVPKHIVCKTPDEAAAASDQLTNGGGAMVKAQIHAGGRGAGELLGHSERLGGVKFAANRDKAKAIAELMFKYPLKTLQTGPEGQKIQTVIVQADAEPDK